MDDKPPLLATPLDVWFPPVALIGAAFAAEFGMWYLCGACGAALIWSLYVLRSLRDDDEIQS